MGLIAALKYFLLHLNVFRLWMLLMCYQSHEVLF